MKGKKLAILLVLALMPALAAPAGAKNLGLSDAQSVVWSNNYNYAVLMADGSLMVWGNVENDRVCTPVKLMDDVRSV